MLDLQTLASYTPAIIGAIGLAAFALYCFLGSRTPAPKTPEEFAAATRAAIARENNATLAISRLERTPRAWKHFER